MTLKHFLLLGTAIDVVASLSTHTVSMPLQQGYRHGNVDISDRVMRAFHEMIDSEEFIHEASNPAIYKVPVIGDDFSISFGQLSRIEAPLQTEGEGTNQDFSLRVQGGTEDDFCWLCRKVYENRDSFTGVDLSNLRDAVFMHVNKEPPHPGYAADARSAKGNVERLFNAVSSGASTHVLDELASNGFVVIDDVIKTSNESNLRLTNYLQKKTGQSEEVRTDKVGFLQEDDARACGLQNHYDFLMELAPYLNKHLHLQPSNSAPIAPASYENPLTNPSEIQAAEYGQGDFYIAHSDNSWAPGQHLQVRNNFRSFTGILYCNENWDENDGGALRIYLDSTHVESAQDAVNLCEHVDVLPKNGRLILFDSTLVHSVEKVVTNRVRRALTVWIKRPVGGNVQGELVTLPP